MLIDFLSNSPFMVGLRIFVKILRLRKFCKNRLKNKMTLIPPARFREDTPFDSGKPAASGEGRVRVRVCRCVASRQGDHVSERVCRVQGEVCVCVCRCVWCGLQAGRSHE